MEVTLNVTEEKFNEFLQKELEAFSKEEIKEIIRECIAKQFEEPSILKNLLVTNETYYGSSYTDYRPTELMRQAAATFDLSPAYKEIQEKMINYMKENFQELMTKVVADIFCQGLSRNSNLEYAMKNVVYSELSHINNN